MCPEPRKNIASFKEEACVFLKEKGFLLEVRTEGAPVADDESFSFQRAEGECRLSVCFSQSKPRTASRPPRFYANVRAERMLEPEDPEWQQPSTVYRAVVCLTDNWKEQVSKRLEVCAEKLTEAIAQKCPHCGGKMIKRIVQKEGDLKGKEFWGCLQYPRCRGIRAEWKTPFADEEGKLIPALQCPKCQSPMVVRFVKREDSPRYGRKFYGCRAYPRCNGAMNCEEATAYLLMSDQPDSDVWRV